MIKRLMWTIWTPMSSVLKKAVKLNLSLSLEWIGASTSYILFWSHYEFHNQPIIVINIKRYSRSYASVFNGPDGSFQLEKIYIRNYTFKAGSKLTSIRWWFELIQIAAVLTWHNVTNCSLNVINFLVREGIWWMPNMAEKLLIECVPSGHTTWN